MPRLRNQSIESIDEFISLAGIEKECYALDAQKAKKRGEDAKQRDFLSKRDSMDELILVLRDERAAHPMFEKVLARIKSISIK